MPPQNSPEQPLPVRTASRLLADYIRRLGAIWVEGQIAELRRRRSVAYLTLRDTDVEMSIPVAVALDRLDGSAVAAGQRIVALLRVEYWTNNGSLQWRAMQLRPVGVGALMQRLEELRKTLAAEGLFADERKKPLPFLPRRVGLICGRQAAAYRDVVVNAQERWPATSFAVREVAVQGPHCVPQVVAALRDLDAVDDVDVIVIARGGGSFEDLLGFSNEALLREVAATRTPVVSAIGHEEDSPLLDFAADRRASTPTAAGRMVVPDAAEERESLGALQLRLRRDLHQSLQRERSALAAAAARLAHTSPVRMLDRRREGLATARSRIRSRLAGRLQAERTRLEALRSHPGLARPQRIIAPARADTLRSLTALRRAVCDGVADRREQTAADAARLRVLSPQGTLDRGYAVVRRPDGALVTDAGTVVAAEPLRVRVRTGSFAVTVAVPHERDDRRSERQEG
jgi:exodeoxyribonuclease VII large subunit